MENVIIDWLKPRSFLQGDWKLNYRFPASDFSPTEGTGQGMFKKMLDDKFIRFDYTCSITLLMDQMKPDGTRLNVLEVCFTRTHHMRVTIL